MLYIYSRVSTDKQDTENQLARLRELYPNASFVEETASGTRSRPLLDALLLQLQSGDTLIVYAIDRLGRRASEVLTLIEKLGARGITLKSIREGIDISTIAGKLVMQVLASVAEMEVNLIRERTKAALAAKRKQGIVGGRRPTYSQDLIKRAKELRLQGKTLKEVAAETGISISRIAQLSKKPAH